MDQHAELFQIWFDPNLQKTLQQPPSYSDYDAHQFPVQILTSGSLKTLIGPGSPFQIDTPGIQFSKLVLDAGGVDLPLNPSSTTSIYLLEGDALVNGEVIRTSDFAVITETNLLEITVFAQTILYILQSPQQPDYTTYARQPLHPQ
jgi:redox-sensitive bicupin YhaK (pirin superfamily)